MKTYFLLLQKLGKTDKIIYPKQQFNKKSTFIETTEYWDQVYRRSENYNCKLEINKLQTTIYMYINYLNTYDEPITTKIFAKIKQKKIYEYLTSSVFAKLNNEMLDLINKTQRAYNGFALLAKIYRAKYIKPTITTDLLLNELHEKQKNTIKIFQNNSNYLFTIKDLINHIDVLLSNTQSFFAEPLPIKNPYNNIEFTEATLYNIYFKIKQSDYKFSTLFHNYFLCDFDLKRFKIENEYLIRDEYIKQYVYKTNTITLFRAMKRMLEASSNFEKKVSKQINKESFISILRPYYYLYLVYNYHIEGTEKKKKSYILFNRKIFELLEYNPKFGRIYLKKLGSSKNYTTISDLEHPTFTMKEALKYDTSFICEHDDYESESEDEVPLNWRLSSDIISTMMQESDDESEEATFED